MNERVGIVAVCQTPYEGREDRYTNVELTFQTVEKVLEETGLTWTRDGTGIDMTLSCNEEFLDGQLIANGPIEAVAGGHFRPAARVDNDGTFGLYLAVADILCGHYDVVLLTSALKESELNQSSAQNFGFEPIFLRPMGLDNLQAAAMQQLRYMDKSGISREQCAKVVVKNRGNGLQNPYVRFGAKLQMEDVLNSKMMAYPISAQEIKPLCDGACTLILATEEKAKKLTNKPIWVTGMGSAYDRHNLGERELSVSLALEEAAKKAYKMASIGDPRKDLDLVELSEFYAYQELLWSEGLGLCQRGEGGKLIDSGATQMSGEIPINTSGGLLSGNPEEVAGLARIVEDVLQLRGEAGDRQVDGKINKVLAHGTDGPCGQHHCVIILENGL